MSWLRGVGMVCAVYMLVSCSMLRHSTDRTETERIVQKDTVYHNTMQKDSVFFRDSTYVYQQGCTLTIREYHTKYYDRLKLDTVYVSRNDTTGKVTTDTVYVEKKSSLIDTTLRSIGIIALVATVLFFVVNIRNKG